MGLGYWLFGIAALLIVIGLLVWQFKLQRLKPLGGRSAGRSAPGGETGGE